MSDGIQRISGITGLNPVTEHELWRDHDPFNEIGTFAVDLARSASDHRKNVNAKAAARAVETGEDYDVARKAVLDGIKEENSGLATFGELFLLLILSPFLLLSIFLGDE